MARHAGQDRCARKSERAAPEEQLNRPKSELGMLRGELRKTPPEGPARPGLGGRSRTGGLSL